MFNKFVLIAVLTTAFCSFANADETYVCMGWEIAPTSSTYAPAAIVTLKDDAHSPFTGSTGQTMHVLVGETANFQFEAVTGDTDQVALLSVTAKATNASIVGSEFKMQTMVNLGGQRRPRPSNTLSLHSTETLPGFVLGCGYN